MICGENMCIVKGCKNTKNQGEFIGDLCLPCYNMLTTGVIGRGDTFIHKMKNKRMKM